MKKFFTCFITAGMMLYASNTAAQNLTMWYKQPAQKWTDALPVGNGKIGAMIFGGLEDERIQFNESSLWTGGPRDYNKPGAWHYLDSIRALLFAGKQKEAEALAEKEFMGLKSADGNKAGWTQAMMEGKGLKANPAAVNTDDTKWPTMTVPSFDGWEAVGFPDLDGAVWLRTSFDLPANWQPGKDYVLDLNRIRDYDITYVNGTKVGTQQNNEPRKYNVPAALLHAGKNVIAVQVFNFADKGGITGYKDTTKHIGIYPSGNENEKISLNGQWKYWIQDDAPPATGAYQASYQPFGDWQLHFDGTEGATDYRRSLDLSNAIASTTYTNKNIHFTRTCFVSAPDNALVLHMEASTKSSISFSTTLTSPFNKSSVHKISNNKLLLEVAVRNGALHGTALMWVEIKGGTITCVENKLVIKNADEATLYLTAATNFVNYHDVSANPLQRCEKVQLAISKKNYAAIKSAHVADYQKYFNTYSIRLDDVHAAEKALLPTDERLQQFASTGDPSFVALYQQYGRYLLISSSRPGSGPANLQGIWNDLTIPPWGSKYTTNINLEMNYWPAELLNLSPMHQPLFSMIKELSVTGAVTANSYYNAPGWVLHHNTDEWRGTAPINASNHGIWVSGGAWLCQHLWEHYLFTQDINFLRKDAYPLMRAAAQFFTHYLVKDPATGYLISAPSNSPEQGGLVAGPSMDHEIIRALYKNVMAASALLHTDSAFSALLQQQYKQIAPASIGRYGQLKEWMQDIDDTSNKHRHISHLWAMYPGNEINWDETPELMKAARQSLIYRGDAATGWSLGWKLNCWARFKEGNHAYKLLQMLLTPAGTAAGSYNNLFDAHPPFQIDGNFGGAAGIGEMLVQSHTQYVDLLPALPDALSSGEVKGIVVRGGFVMNMQWSNGVLTQVEILSKAGQPLQLRYNGVIKKIATQKNKTYRFNAKLELL